MGRPRVRDFDLPPHVVRRHGAFYVIKDGAWHRLCFLRSELNAAYGEFLASYKGADREALVNYCYKVMVRAGCNARQRGKHGFFLTRADVLGMFEEAGWVCAVTGASFSLEPVGPKRQRPFAPSIDRIDSFRGYERGNCRIVCMATNIAMNTWGAEVLKTLFRAWSRSEKSKIVGQSKRQSEKSESNQR